jgi:hypothetical protein
MPLANSILSATRLGVSTSLAKCETKPKYTNLPFRLSLMHFKTSSKFPSPRLAKGK